MTRTLPKKGSPHHEARSAADVNTEPQSDYLIPQALSKLFFSHFCQIHFSGLLPQPG